MQTTEARNYLMRSKLLKTVEDITYGISVLNGLLGLERTEEVTKLIQEVDRKNVSVVKLMDERTDVSDSNFCGDFRNAFHWYGKIFTNVKFNKINFYISTLEKRYFIQIM